MEEKQEQITKQTEKAEQPKKFKLNKSVRAVIIIIAAVLLLELTIFNRAHYTYLWQDEESSDFTTVSMTYEDGVYRKDNSETERPAFVFEDINRKVNTVYIEPAAKTGKTRFSVVYGDEEYSPRETHQFEVFAEKPFTWYQDINPYGKADYIKIIAHDGNFEVKTVAVNKTIPLDFVFPRFLLVSLLAIGAYFLITSDIRKVIFNPQSNKQLYAFAAVVLSFVIFGSIITSVTGKSYEWLPTAYERMTESVLEGRLDLVTEQTENLERINQLEKPYVPSDRMAAGIDWTTFEWDNSYYKGKVYMQHGIGPVFALFMPHYLLYNGQHISLQHAVFIFGALAGVFIALLWRAIVKKYFPKMPFALFLCTTFAVMWCSLISPQFFYTVKHSVAASSGIMFSALGLWLLVSATDRQESLKQYIMVTAGAFFTAYAVSCRASTALVSFLVPVILWELVWKQNRKRIITVILCVAIPYLIVAIPLMWYNYARFDSIFEFGTGYAITGYNNTVITKLNPAGMVLLALEAVRNLLFQPLHFSLEFPYVSNVSAFTAEAARPVRYLNSYAGMVNFPVYLFLVFVPVVFRNIRKQIQTSPLARMSLSMLLIGTVTACVSYIMVAAIIRYQVDYMFLMLIPALITGYLAWEHFGRSSWFCKAMCVICVISAAVAMPLSGEVAPLWQLPDEVKVELQRVFTFF